MRVISVRKAFCVLVCMFVMFFSGCADQTADPVTSGFRCYIQTNYEGVEIKAVLDCCDASKTFVEFESPNSLDGFRLVFENETIKMEFMGMTFDVPDAYKTETMLLSSMIKALNRAVSHPTELESMFLFDDINGLPLTFTYDERVTVFFSEWDVREETDIA